MKRIITTYFLMLISFWVIAQQAPDFSIDATDGNSHELYADYLDQGYTVVLDFMHVNCPPCHTIAPYMESTYQTWGGGNGDVKFFAITPYDSNAQLTSFENMHGLSYHGAGTNGGSVPVIDPYWNNAFGTFYGFPTIVVLSPDGDVQFDIWGSSHANTAALLNIAIGATGATGGAPLAVELTSFDGEVLSAGIDLEWTTRSETNHLGFSILRSVDGRIFDKIGFLNGTAENGNEHKYSFLDKYPKQGINYYQLVSEDTDGSAEYSSIIQFEWKQTAFELEINPNPIENGILKFVIAGFQNSIQPFQIVDQLGKVVETGQVQTAENLLTINCDNLSAGIYILRIGEGSTHQSKRFLMK